MTIDDDLLKASEEVTEVATVLAAKRTQQVAMLVRKIGEAREEIAALRAELARLKDSLARPVREGESGA